MVTLIIDRFESQWAVLEISAGKTFNFPINLLSKGAKEGDVLNLNIDIDRVATEKRKNKIKELMNDIKKKQQ